jgi:preprotein translocase subunit SecE
VNSWIYIAIWSAVILAVFGFLWKRGQIRALAVYVSETREELKKCSWPTWLELRGSTILIIVSVLLLSVFVVLVDVGLFNIGGNAFLEILLIVAAAVFIAVKSKGQ